MKTAIDVLNEEATVAAHIMTGVPLVEGAMQKKIEAEWQKLAQKHGFDADFERNFSNTGLLTFRQGLEAVASIYFSFQDKYASIYGQAGSTPASTMIGGAVNNLTKYGNSYLEYNDTARVKEGLVWLDKVLGAARAHLGPVAGKKGPVRLKAPSDPTVKRIIAMVGDLEDDEQILQVLSGLHDAAVEFWVPMDSRYERVAGFLQKAMVAVKRGVREEISESGSPLSKRDVADVSKIIASLSMKGSVGEPTVSKRLKDGPQVLVVEVGVFGEAKRLAAALQKAGYNAGVTRAGGSNWVKASSKGGGGAVTENKDLARRIEVELKDLASHGDDLLSHIEREEEEGVARSLEDMENVMDSIKRRVT